MKNLKPYFLPISLMLLIFLESSIPTDGGSNDIAFLTSLNPTLQNLLHIPLYGVLALLWIRSFQKNHFSNGKMILMTLFLTISYGCLDELHQTFVPGRYGGLLDIFLDSLGAFFGILVFYLSRKSPFQIPNSWFVLLYNFPLLFSGYVIFVQDPRSTPGCQDEGK